MISCQSSSNKHLVSRWVDEGPTSEGWLDENTYRVVEEGVAKPGLTDEEKKKVTACEAALVMAQRRFAERFGNVSFEIKGKSITKSFGGMIRRGKVVEKRYDSKTSSCRIIYDVSDEGFYNKWRKSLGY